MDLINDILMKMHIGGNNPKNKTPMAACFSTFLFICLCICFTLGTLFIKTNEYKALGFCMRDMLLMVGVWQVTLFFNIKIIVLKIINLYLLINQYISDKLIRRFAARFPVLQN